MPLRNLSLEQISEDGIALEINAYALGARFESAPQVPFSVESEVSTWIQQGKF